MSLADTRAYASLTAWTHNPQDPGYKACGQMLWDLARYYARKFTRGSGAVNRLEPVHGHTAEDLAMVASLHVLIQAKRGRLAKVPPSERWFFIRKMLWNRMLDESRRFRNRYELQPPALPDGDGGDKHDSDYFLDIVAASGDFAVSQREVGMLETILDTALTSCPDEMLIKLRFGLLRNDEMDDWHTSYLGPLNLEDLAKMGYGADRFAVKRRIDRALKSLRAVILRDLEARGVGNIIM
jgi:hypothetical protein